MPIDFSIYRIDQGPSRLAVSRLESERELEELLESDIGIASTDWMVIGRQVPTSTGGRADLVCIDRAGDLSVVELKRDRTPREVVAQLLEYGWWARTLTPTDIAAMFAAWQKRRASGHATASLDDEFRRRFGAPLPEEWEPGHQLVLISSELDSATERILAYLAEEHDVSINALFFQVLIDGDHRYLARAWLREPSTDDSGGPVQARDGEARTATRGPKTEWNGEFYVSFGYRDWDDARRYGYISAGGDPWYVRTLKTLAPGDRVWTHIPKTGFVGVGRVMESAVPFSEFKVTGPTGHQVPITEAPLNKPVGHQQGEADAVEHFVRVRWLKTVPVSECVWESGFFANQNTVARPKDAKWTFTVQRLKDLWQIRD